MKRRIMSAVLALCLLLPMLPVSVLAADPAPTSGSCGESGNNVTWRLSGGTLTISGSGKMQNYHSKNIPWYSYIDQITSVTVSNGITNISSAAFFGSKNLSRANIPAGVNLIGDAAFFGCTSLNSIVLLDGLETLNMKVFAGCSNLSSITLPDSLSVIGDEVFSGCNNLSSITLPDSLYYIGPSAFSGCSKLMNVTLPDKVTTIQEYAFSGCSGLSSISIPEGVDSIDFYTFSDCINLTHVAIPTSVTAIKKYAFYQCGLTDIYYGGSKEDWEKISIGDPNTELAKATIHYNSQMPESFTVTFDSQGGSTVSSQAIISSGKVPKPADPTWSGHTFVGWYKEAACLNEWKFDTDTVIGNTTLYAKWTENTPPTSTEYTVTFDLNYSGATDTPNTQTVNKDSTATEPDPAPIRTDYTFDGWYKESNCENKWDFSSDTVTENTTLYAKWTENPTKYTVTFDLNYSGATGAPNTQTVDKDSTATEPTPAPIRTDYTFDGWYKEADCENKWNFDTDTVTGDTTLYAKWTENTPPTPPTYTVTINLGDGGTLGSGITTLTVNADGKVERPAQDPTRPGYIFVNWYTDASCTTVWDFSTHTVNSNTTIYAGWELDPSNPPTPPTYTVTINLGDGGTLGSGITTLTVNADGKVERPAQDPTRPGYIFIDWYTDASCTTVWDFSTHTVNSNTTIYAGWKKDDSGTTTPGGDITVTVNLGGGTLGSGTTTLTVNADGKVERPAQNPTRPGYIFIGWYMDASCTEIWDFSTHTVNSNTTIYAGWEKDSGTTTGTYHRIHTDYYTSGGRVYMNHSSAVAGTRVTIEVSPRSGYELDWLSVFNLNTERELPLTQRYRDEYTFIMPDSPVGVEVSFLREDADRGGWYAPAASPVSYSTSKTVKWYYQDGQIRHVTDGPVPYGTLLTRDMLISVLYNMDPSSSGEPLFWATKQKVIPDIYLSGLWGMDQSISREQAAMILYNYSRHMGYSLYPSANLTGCTDYAQLRSVARTAMSWAQATGLFLNHSQNTLSPKSTLTCEEANVLFSRFASVVARTG